MRHLLVLLTCCLGCGGREAAIDVALPWEFPETNGLHTPIARLQPVVFSLQRGGVTLLGEVDEVTGWLDVWDPDGRIVPVHQLEEPGLFKVFFPRVGRHVVQGRAGGERSRRLVVEVVESKGIRLAHTPLVVSTVWPTRCERALTADAPIRVLSNQRLAVPLVPVDVDDRPLLGLLIEPAQVGSPTANLWVLQQLPPRPLTVTFTDIMSETTVELPVEGDHSFAVCPGG